MDGNRQVESDRPDAGAVPSTLALSRFEPALNSTFQLIRCDAEPAIPVRLVEVRQRSAPGGYEQYSLLFLAPGEPVLPQATYALRHPAIGEVSLFVVPVGRDEAGVRYEACIARELTDDERRG